MDAKSIAAAKESQGLLYRAWARLHTATRELTIEDEDPIHAIRLQLATLQSELKVLVAQRERELDKKLAEEEGDEFD